MLDQVVDVASLHEDVSADVLDIEVPHALRVDARGTKSRPIAQDLPITVSIVRTSDQLQRVCDLRAMAYGVRNSQFGALLTKPEKADLEPGNIILVAESKETGEVLGTMRIHTNLFGVVPMETVVPVPEFMRGQLLAEACRFCIKPGAYSACVRLALFKAIYLYCYANQVQYILCVAKKPLNKVYKGLGFKPLNGGNEELWKRVSYVGNIEHSMLALDILRVDALWYEKSHHLYGFVRRAYHPDIKIFSSHNAFL